MQSDSDDSSRGAVSRQWPSPWSRTATPDWIIWVAAYGRVRTERDTDTPTASYWGSYERVAVVNSMSKAYGLPGLRLGWLAAPEELVAACWRRHEYAAISACMMSMKIAEYALVPMTRERLMRRARGLIRRGFDTLTEALRLHPGVYSVVPPLASAMSFVRFDLPICSDDFAARLLAEKDVLVIPGSKFGIEGHFRFSSALPEEHLREGLTRLNDLTREIQLG